jgi:hypothetical protein
MLINEKVDYTFNYSQFRNYRSIKLLIHLILKYLLTENFFHILHFLERLDSNIMHIPNSFHQDKIFRQLPILKLIYDLSSYMLMTITKEFSITFFLISMKYLS